MGQATDWVSLMENERVAWGFAADLDVDRCQRHAQKTGTRRLLARYAAHPDPTVRAAVAGNRRTPGPVVMALLHDSDQLVHRQAVKHPSLPADLLDTLYSTSATYQNLVLANPPCPADLFDDWQETDDAKDRRPAWEALASNPNAPPAALRAAVHVTGDRIPVNLAENPSTPPDVLTRLVSMNHDTTRVLLGVARHHHTAQADLARLSRSTHSTVRACTAQRESCPSAAFRQLVNDSEPSVRVAAAGNRSLAGPLAHLFAHDPQEQVRRAIAANLTCPAEVLGMLAHDRSKKVRKTVADTARRRQIALDEHSTQGSLL